MTKQERLFLVIAAIENSGMDVHDLVEMLELDVRELCMLMPNYLLQMEHKFILQDALDEAEDDSEEDVSWEDFEEEELGSEEPT